MPDPTGVRINVPPDLADSGPRILAIAAAIGDELTQLRGLLAPLHDYWSGQSQIGWQDLQTMWDAAAGNLMSTSGTLGAIGHTAGVNWENYVNCETSNTTTWRH